LDLMIQIGWFGRRGVEGGLPPRDALRASQKGHALAPPGGVQGVSPASDALRAKKHRVSGNFG
jgi:hypothetical protein